MEVLKHDMICFLETTVKVWWHDMESWNKEYEIF